MGYFFNEIPDFISVCRSRRPRETQRRPEAKGLLKLGRMPEVVALSKDIAE